MKNNVKRWIAIMIAVTLAVGCLPGNLQRKIGAQPEVKAEETINDPRIVTDASMEAGQKVTWDCIWFGSYPQTEIVDQASTSGAYGKDWTTSSDYEVNTSLYNSLKSATGWNSNGDITYSGVKYRRIKESDATYATSGDCGYYNWSDYDTYHYFRYEKIKWRVLKVSDGKALLLADQALDDQRYNTSRTDVTWETSTIRSWLNGYGAGSNAYGTDYSSRNFIRSAFSSAERGAVQTTQVVNDDNISNGTEGGAGTSDKVFLLSEAEVYTDAAKSYGFVSDSSTYDEARRSKSSTYAKAMGTMGIWSGYGDGVSYEGNCYWWLRSPGLITDNAANVDVDGYVNYFGGGVSDYGSGVRPALNLNLSSSDLWSYAGTVCSDGTDTEVGGGSNGSEYPIDLKEDVWSFRNPAKGGISYQLYKDMFGEIKGTIAYLKGGNGDGGLCYGMAQTVLASYLGFPKISSYESIGGFTPPEKLWDVQAYAYNYDINSSAMDLIRRAFVYQYTFDSTLDSAMTKDDVEGLYQAAIDFQENGGEPVSITISSGYSIARTKGFHEVAVIGVEKLEDCVNIKVYDCNQPGDDIYFVLFGSPGSFTGEWAYRFNDNENIMESHHSGDDKNSHFKYRTVTNDFINTYKSKMGVSKLSNSKSNSSEKLMIALDKNTQGKICYGGESVNIEDIYDNESNSIFPVEVAVGDDGQSDGIICWLFGSEQSFTCQDVSADSEITFAGSDAAVSVKASAQSDISADSTDNTVTIAESEGAEFTVDYDYIEDGKVNRVEVTGVSDGNVTVVPVDKSASVDGAADVQVKTTTFMIEEEASDQATEENTESTTPVKKKTTVSRITLTGISKKIARGKKIKLTATVLPKNATNKKLKWSTSNKKLATVTQSGLVKIAKKAKPGKTVKITVAATDGSGKKQVWAIKVMKGAVKKITVKGYKKTLKAGKTMKLKAKVKVTKGKPVNKKLKWTSLSPKYATITQTGKVKAKPAGKGKTVKIKVESTDGTNKSVVKKIKIK